MNLSNFHFDLPPDLIGQKAIEPRDKCRLMVLQRNENSIYHSIFSDLTQILDRNSVLVINDTKYFRPDYMGKNKQVEKLKYYY